MVDRPSFGLTTKVLLPLLSLVLAFCVPLSWLINNRDAANQRQTMHAALESFIDLQAQALAPLLWSFENDAISVMFEAYARFPDIQSVALYDDHNRLINHLGEVDTGDFNPTLRMSRDIFSERKNGSERIGSITVTFQEGRLKEYWEERQREDLMLTFGLMVMIALSTIVVVRVGVRNPLRRLLASLERARTELVREPVKWSSRDELGQVVLSYNDLLVQQAEAEKKVIAYQDHLEELVHQRTQELERDRNNLRLVLEELADRGAYLNAVIEGAGTGVVCMNPGGKILEANLEFARFVKIREGEIENNNFYELIAYEDYDRIRLDAEKVINGGVERIKTECRFMEKGGGLRWGTLTMVALSNSEEGPRLIVVIDDVTELKRSHEQFRALLESAPDAMVITTEDGNISVVNLRAESLFGFSRNEMIGLKIQDLIKPVVDNDGAESTPSGARGEEESVAIRKNGERVPVDVSSSPIETDEGVFVARTLRDATLRKESQAQLENAKQMAEDASKAKSYFLANMSHEIRTPMNAIIGLTYLVMGGELRPREKDYMAKIQAAAQSLLGIINDILDFSKIEAGKMSIDELEFSVEDVFNTLTAALSVRVVENGPELLFTVDPEIPRTVIGDPQRLIQVLLNLGSNAIKFTSSGDVQISCTVGTDNGDGVVLDFSVTDTGIGMSDEHQERLFQAFSQADGSITRRFGGTGLGLVISQQLVRLMGGQIVVKSKLGEGSCFSFSVRLKKGKDNSKLVPLPDSLFFAGLQVLVIDDNHKSGKILSTYLHAFGCVSHYVDSGEKAIEVISGNGHPFGAILLDWRMPGLSGQETIQKLQQYPSAHGIPIIVMVTTSDRDYMSVAPEASCIAAWMVKPISPSSLLDAMMEAFGKEGHVSTRNLGNVAVAKMSGRILLVEDNELNQQVATELLRAVGLEITIANNGKEGVDMLEQSTYDIVLMDVQMPVMDGYTATQLIRKNKKWKDLPVIAMTANAMGGDRERALNAGMNDHISKPIDVNLLYDVVGRWLKDKIPQISETSPHSPLDARPSAFIPSDPLPSEESGKMTTDNASDDGLIVNVDIGLKHSANNKGLYMRLVQKFIDRERDVVDRLKTHLGEADRESTIRTVHTLKSSALTLGAQNLGAIAARLEAFWKDGGDLTEDLEDIRIMERALPGVFAFFVDFQANKPVQTNINTVSTIDVSGHLDKLEKMIADNDADAKQVAQTLVNSLTGTPLGIEAQKMAARLQDYDFDAAQQILSSIKATVGRKEAVAI